MTPDHRRDLGGTHLHRLTGAGRGGESRSMRLRTVLLALSLAHCEASRVTFTEPAGDGGASASDAPSAPEDVVQSPDVAPIPVRDSGINANCSEAAQLVYVLSDASELYSFRPNLRQFTRIGRIRCPTDMQPNSMAIDRNAVAWVNFVAGGLGDTAGAIYRVSTTDASCTGDPPIRMPNGWLRVGMGFSTAGADTTDEALFVAGTADPFGGPSRGLGRYDAASQEIVPIGAFTAALRGQSAELTGTGDGRLFGFFTTTPVRVAEIDKATAAIVNSAPLTQVETPQAWAFSFWGGDFYLYTAGSALLGGSSNVTRYRPSDGSVDTGYMRQVGFRILGAGVSTCAPILPPG